MKKIIILAWFFPPNNHTAAQRARAWANYFRQYDLYPVIITRNWDSESSDLLRVEYFDNYEVHYTPYRTSFKENFLNSSIGSFKPLRFLYLTLSLLFEYTFIGFKTYKNIKNYSLAYIEKNSDAKLLLITGAPFHLFKIGYLANKKYGIKYVIDYRDGWNEDEAIYIKQRWFAKIKLNIDQYFEKKWSKKILFFTTVSEHIKNRIADSLGKSGHVIYNGFFEEDFSNLNSEINEDLEFRLVYSGTLYFKSQPLDILAEGFKLLVNDYESKKISIRPKLIFLGTGVDIRSERIIREKFSGVENYIIITERIPKKEASKVLISADAFVMVCHRNNAKGIASSKIFEYLLMQKPILISPSDNDIVNEIGIKSGLGMVGNTKKKTYEALLSIIAMRESGEKLVGNWEYIKAFSRENQTKVLANLINKYI